MDMRVGSRTVKWASGLLLLWANSAAAHTITFGYENAGPGSVTFWYGSYHTHGNGDGPDLEGSLDLVGVNGNPFPLTNVSFTLERGGASCTGSPAVCSGQPSGLIDGVTNFIDPNYSGPYSDVFSWQGVTFSGLAAGDYQFTYIPIAFPSAHWAPWSDAVRTGTVTLTGDIVGTVPEPASIAVTGIGLLGLGALRRRRKAKA